MTSRRYEVWGSPISHTLSPVLHAAAYEALGMDWHYRAHEVDADRLAQSLETLDESVWGVSLTMPLKEDIVGLVSDHRGPVDILHAANTLVRDGQEWWLDNTDWWGASEVFHRFGGVTGKTVWILGAGATARAILYALAEHQPATVVSVVRSPERAAVNEVLAQTLGLTHQLGQFSQLAGALAPDWVVSTIPGGGFEGLAEVSAHSRGALLFDVAYRPWPSELAKHWLGEGAGENLGLWMLCFQALAQVRAFVGGNSAKPLEKEALVLEAMVRAVGLAPDVKQ